MGKISHKEKTNVQRLHECNEVLKKHRNRVCIYIEKQDTCKSLNDLEKKTVFSS